MPTVRIWVCTKKKVFKCFRDVWSEFDVLRQTVTNVRTMYKINSRCIPRMLELVATINACYVCRVMVRYNRSTQYLACMY